MIAAVIALATICAALQTPVVGVQTEGDVKAVLEDAVNRHILQAVTVAT